MEAHTVQLPGGSRKIALPEDLSEMVLLDTNVCERRVLTSLALRTLEAAGTTLQE